MVIIMNLKQIHYFLVVAQEHQITSAAKLLYMAQPPLSYQIKQLENELGVKLFVRKPHGLELTSAGISFRNYAQRIVNLADNAREELRRDQNGTMGILRIGVMSSAGNFLPNSKIQQLTNYYPQVNFKITEANTFKLVNLLNNGLIDIAVVRTPFNQQGLLTKKIATDQMAIVYNTNSFQLPKKKLSLSLLSHQPLILYRRFESLLNDSFAQEGLRPFYAVMCDDARTAILWADRGMGIAVVPQSIAQLYSTSHVQSIDHPAWNTEVMLAWPKTKDTTPLIQRFIQSFEIL